MPKNIVILLDGTSNGIKAKRTNILRLYGTLEKSDDQIVYYDPGVGTFGAENAWLGIWRKAVEIWGLATGWGLDHNVKEAYRFLVETYDRGEGSADRDRIFIFGFSRGAYSARVLAGFLHAFGLIEPRNANLIDYAYRAYKRIGESGEGRDGAFSEMRLYERLLEPDRPPIRLIGLFDTVASVIEHGRYGPRLRTHAFTKKNPSVESVRHAVAIEERRTMFRPQLWPEGVDYRSRRFDESSATPQDVREVWFTGVHGDVGGGYDEDGSGLAKLPLRWMIEQTEPTGLRYRRRTIDDIVLGLNPSKPYAKPNAMADAHNSMKWLWVVLEFLPRRRYRGSRRFSLFGFMIPFFERRRIPDGARIHRSVIERGKARGRMPSNLPSSYQIED